MSTHLHRFVPSDVRHVPSADISGSAIDWLRMRVNAYRVEAVTPGHITFFDCGGGLDLVACPHCRTDIGPLWKNWMDESYAPKTGFTLTERTLPCCAKAVRLDQLIFDPLCAFGSFAIEITDTMTTWTDEELCSLLLELEARLQCSLVRVDAHY